MDPSADEQRKREVLEALRRALQEREKGIREHLLSRLSDQVEAALAGLSELPPLNEDLFVSAPAPPSPRIAFSDLREAVDQVATSADQVSILQKLMEGAARFAGRAAVFVCRKGEAVGWSASGFDDAANEIRRVRLALEGESAVAAAASRVQRVEGGDNGTAGSVWEALGAGPSPAFVALPLEVKGRVVAVLFADAGPASAGESLHGDALVILAKMAERSLEALPLRGRAGARPHGGVGRRSSETWPSSASPPASAPLPELANPQPGPSDPATPPPDPLLADGIPGADAPPGTASRAEAAVSVGEGPAPDEEHEKARRFARLLVSEILLYNEREVEEGRRNGDLFERLRPDLERSQRTYLQRVPAGVAKDSNYFDEEVVRTLANGDASLLGPQ